MKRLVRTLLLRRAGAVGLALSAWDVWRRIPPQHRRRILSEVRKQAPRMAEQMRRRRPYQPK